MGAWSRSGTMVSLRCRSPRWGSSPNRSRLATEMLYACPNVAVTHRLVALNAALPTYMRAPGEASGVFALESAMDEMAVALKMDPDRVPSAQLCRDGPAREQAICQQGAARVL